MWFFDDSGNAISYEDLLNATRANIAYLDYWDPAYAEQLEILIDLLKAGEKA